MTDKEFLNWIADRLVHVYGESPSTDFVHKLRGMAQRQWVGLTDEEIDRRLCPTKNEFEIDDRFWDGVDWAKAQIKGENT